MWQYGIAFIRGLNIYGKNRITQRKLMHHLKQLESDQIRILKIVKTDDILFMKNGIHYATVGREIERKLKAVLGKDVYVTTRSITTLSRVQNETRKLQKLNRLPSY